MSSGSDASQSILLTPRQMAAADQAAIDAGARGVDLMEAAGKAVAETVTRQWPVGTVCVLCGPGNNGGDGFVAARYLRERGWTVRVGLLGGLDSLTPDAAHHARLWGSRVDPLDVTLVNDVDVSSMHFSVPACRDPSKEWLSRFSRRFKKARFRFALLTFPVA